MPRRRVGGRDEAVWDSRLRAVPGDDDLGVPRGGGASFARQTAARGAGRKGGAERLGSTGRGEELCDLRLRELPGCARGAFGAPPSGDANCGKDVSARQSLSLPISLKTGNVIGSLMRKSARRSAFWNFFAGSGEVPNEARRTSNEENGDRRGTRRRSAAACRERRRGCLYPAVSAASGSPLPLRIAHDRCGVVGGGSGPGSIHDADPRAKKV